jgi:Domain of unknown function (DUF4372)
MNCGRTIFAQLMDLLPLAEFRRCVERCQGDYKVQSFSCLDQFLCLAFAQLTYRESLRDIETCLRAHHSQLYHMGFRGGVSRNTLANANQQRDWRRVENPQCLRRERPRENELIRRGSRVCEVHEAFLPRVFGWTVC